MGDVIKFSDLTPDQQRALVTDGRVVISAAAGSGKTTAMLVAIADKIRAGASLKNMLILVYNDATAIELKEKLRDELFLRACTSSGEEAKIYRKQLDELSFAHINTIHAFCQALIRENFEKLGISPSFSVLDEVTHQSYMSRALDKVFALYDESGDDVFKAVSTVFAKTRNDDDFRSCLIKLYQHLDVQPDRVGFSNTIENCYADPYKNAFIDILVSSAKCAAVAVEKESEDLLPILIGCGENSYADNALSINRAMKTLLLISDSPSRGELDTLISYSAISSWLSSARKKTGSDTAEEIINRIKNCQTAAKNTFLPFAVFADKDVYVNDFMQNKRYVEKLLEIILNFDKELYALKAADNVLSFSDLEHKATELIDILKSNGELDNVAVYDYVFVDECQDVNPTQEYIINSLISKNAFMVGDVKQSIYGFRLADPDLFLKHYEDALSEGKAVSFNRNFRSHSQILEFVNGVFSAVMTLESADIDYANEAAFEKETGRTSGTVELHLFSMQKPETRTVGGLYKLLEDTPGEEDGDVTEYEAAFIASKINELVGKAPADDKGNLLSYGDIAILLRSRNTSASKIMSVLRAEGIPVDDAAFSRDDDHPEKELINYLKVLDNPRQDIPLCGFLMSWFGGLDENELNEISRFAKGTDLGFYDALLRRSQTDDYLGEKINSLLSTMDNYRLKASFLSVGELLSAIVRDYSYDALLMKSGEAVVNALEGFLTSVAEAGTVGISTFLGRYAELNLTPDKKPSGGNRVHVSTYHGYKGLEIPVVFLPNTGATKSTKSYSGDVIMTGKGYIGLNRFDFDGKTKSTNTLSKIAVTTLIKEREHKEEMRLFYVALTRAKKYLYITGAGDAQKFNRLDDKPIYSAENSRLALLETARNCGFITTDAIGHSDISEFVKSQKKEAPLLEYDSVDPDELSNIVRAVSEGRKASYTHLEATTLAMKYSVSALQSIGSDAVLLDDKDAGETRRYEDKTDIGTLYHKVMENIDFCAADKPAVKSELERLVQEGTITDKEKDSLDIDGIVSTLASPIMRLAAKSVCLREKSFMMYVPANEAVEGVTTCDMVLVQGVIDLIIRADKTILVDYKYSALKNREARKKYKKQLYLYKMALETAFSEKIASAYVLSLKTGETFSMEELDAD